MFFFVKKQQGQEQLQQQYEEAIKSRDSALAATATATQELATLEQQRDHIVKTLQDSFQQER